MSICVVQTRPGIGDMCIFLPYIQLISKHKKSKVILITKSRSRAKEFLFKDPNISEVIYYDEDLKKNKFRLFFFLKKKKIKEIYIFQFDFKFFLISFLAKIKKIFHYGFFKKNVSITAFVFQKTRDWLKIPHLKLPKCKIYFEPTVQENNNIIIGIGGSGSNKKWSIKNYITLIGELSKKIPNKSFIIAGGNKERVDAEQILQRFKNVKSICDLNISETLNYLSKSKFYIGNDTGFMHLASSLGVLSFGIFGDTPTDYSSYNQLIVPIMPPNYNEVKQNDGAMSKISVKHVLKELEKKKII